MWPGPYGNWGSRKYLITSLNQSLRRMGLDYVDVFYSHRYDPDTPEEETLQALVDIVKQGKALYAGISRWPLEASRGPDAASCHSRHWRKGYSQTATSEAYRPTPALQSTSHSKPQA